MNIAFFTNAYKPIISGVVNSIELLCKGFNYYGHKTYVFAPDFPKYKDKEENIYRFKSVNLTNKIKFPIPIPFSNRIFNIFPKLNIDIIHTQHPFLLGEVGANLGKKYNIPIIFTFHTQYEQYTHYIPFNQKLMKMLTKASVINYIKKCDLIISPTESIKNFLLDYHVAKPVEVVPNSIEVEKFRNISPEIKKEIKNNLGIKDDEKVLIYIGRMALEKNLAFMLQSYKIILKEKPATKLVIIGEGPELEALKSLALQLGINKNVIFTGRIEYPEIPNYITIADIFIVTSTTEVRPLAIIEAFACGLPVVSLDVPWARDIIKDSVEGILAPQNAAKYSEKVIELLYNEDNLKKISANARAAAGNYSLYNTAKKFIDIYAKQIELKSKITPI